MDTIKARLLTKLYSHMLPMTKLMFRVTSTQSLLK
jgi:hypothetical protein